VIRCIGEHAVPTRHVCNTVCPAVCVVETTVEEVSAPLHGMAQSVLLPLNFPSPDSMGLTRAAMQRSGGRGEAPGGEEEAGAASSARGDESWGGSVFSVSRISHLVFERCCHGPWQPPPPPLAVRPPQAPPLAGSEAPLPKPNQPSSEQARKESERTLDQEVRRITTSNQPPPMS
jgi:hypothetical protein